MAVFLDARPYATGLGPASTIAEFIESARQSLAGSGRMLIGLRCDENEVSPDQLDALLVEPLSRFDRLELTSDRPARVVEDILLHARSCLGQSFDLVRDASDKLSGGDCGEAMTVLIACIRSWGQVHEAIVKGGQLMGIDFETLQIRDRSVQAWLASLVDRLRDIKSAVECNDLVLLADMLKYELDESLQEWEAFVDGFIDHVRASDKSARTTATVP